MGYLSHGMNELDPEWNNQEAKYWGYYEYDDEGDPDLAYDEMREMQYE